MVEDVPAGSASASAGSVPLEALAGYLKALANPKRLRVLQFLVRPRSLEDIASELGVARQTAQEHVQQLTEVGLVTSSPGRGDHGPVTQYLLAPQRLFNVYEMIGRLGDLEPELEEAVETRNVTRTEDTVPRAPREKDLPRLTIVHGMRVGHTALLAGEGPWLVGRDPHALVGVDYDPYASSRHAELRRVPGGFVVADLYSSNGTYVDWKRLPRGGVEKIENGTLLRVGKTLLLFRKPSG